MSKRLRDVLNNSGENYILPFFWMYGDSEEKLRKEVQKIHECEIGAFCVESHSHPEFVGGKWWQDLDILIDEAKKYDMRIWILDDVHFPTGQAGGKIELLKKENRKFTLGNRHIDVTGPLAGSIFIPPVTVKIETLMYVCASRLDEGGKFINLTDCFQKGKLYFDVPEGSWRIYYFFKDDSCLNANHINFLREGGAIGQIQAVYEPHYEHYQEEFGKTIAGFFSDEPGFYTSEARNNYFYDLKLGHLHLLLVWDYEMKNWLEESMKKPIEEILPCLVDDYCYGYIDNKNETAAIRYAYMDFVSERYEKCFCNVLGNWCRAHGVEYIGHIFEDNNIHSQIGVSTGHFFRSMRGQDFAGADTVMGQLVPGMEDMFHSAVCGFPENRMADGEFYSAALYQMAVSQAQIEPHKKGRALCEVYGAYGWGEGTRLMKWISDFMLVRGINRFVPHSFSPKEFPDPSYPPHFYANGNNPQFEAFKRLMPYVNRTAHLIDGGRHCANIAIMYHGDNTWSAGEAMFSQKSALKLMNENLQYDIIPYDALISASVENKRLKINTQSYSLLIVPYSQFLTEKQNNLLGNIDALGVEVVFIDALPQYLLCCGGGGSIVNCKKDYPLKPLFKTVTLNEIGKYAKQKIQSELSVSHIEHTQLLRSYVYRHDDDFIYIFSNQHPAKKIAAKILFNTEGFAYEYDAYRNKIYHASKSFNMSLSPYETTIFVVTGEDFSDVANYKPSFENVYFPKTEKWKISLCTQKEYPFFKLFKETDSLKYGEITNENEEFSGIARYETNIFAEDFDAKKYVLKLDGVNESAQVWINGEDLGMCISYPYIADISGKLKKGKNNLKIELRNTLYNSIHDRFSRYLPLEPLGLGGISILYY